MSARKSFREMTIDEKIDRAWGCILDPEHGHLPEIIRNTKKDGVGVTVFKFLPPSRTRSNNASMTFYRKDEKEWDEFTKNIDLERYNDISTQALVCVTVPMDMDPKDCAMDIRLVEYSS